MCSKPFVCIIHMSSQHSACTGAEPEKLQQAFPRNTEIYLLLGLIIAYVQKFIHSNVGMGGLSVCVHASYIYIRNLCNMPIRTSTKPVSVCMFQHSCCFK